MPLRGAAGAWGRIRCQLGWLHRCRPRIGGFVLLDAPQLVVLADGFLAFRIRRFALCEQIVIPPPTRFMGRLQLSCLGFRGIETILEGFQHAPILPRRRDNYRLNKRLKPHEKPAYLRALQCRSLRQVPFLSGTFRARIVTHSRSCA